MIDLRLCDARNRYDRELIEAYLPLKYPEEFRPTLKAWFDALPPKFGLEKYISNMRKSFRDLGTQDPRGPFHFTSKLASRTGGETWASSVAHWMGELLACAYPDDAPMALQRRIDLAMTDPAVLSPEALNLGRALWREEKLGDADIYNRLNRWL